MTEYQNHKEQYDNGYIFTSEEGTTIAYNAEQPHSVTTQSGDTCQVSGKGSVFIPANRSDGYTVLEANDQLITAQTVSGMFSTATAENTAIDEHQHDASVDNGVIANTFSEYNPATWLIDYLDEDSTLIPSDARAFYGAVLEKAGVTCEKDGLPTSPVLEPENIRNMAQGSLGEKLNTDRSR